MRIVFWQHILSMIDLPYIIELVDYPDIKEVVVVAQSLSSTRKDMGWDTDFPGLERCVVFINPQINTIREILQSDVENSVHLFTGLSAFPHVFLPFKMSLDYPLRRGIISERPMTYGSGIDNMKPLWLHRLRFRLHNAKYINKIDYVFEIGEETTHYYKSISNKWKVFPFAYCTRANYQEIPENKPNRMQICYVGSLIKRKSVMTLLKASEILYKEGIADKFDINIVGEGNKGVKLRKFVSEHHLLNVHFLGSMQNKELPHFLVNQDVFVLPSIHDGWGAVLNEALQAGLYTICSDRCGGKELLSQSYLGEVFETGNYHQLATILEKSVINTSTIRGSQKKRMIWAEKHICGKVIAQYMIDCLNDQNVTPPWRL